MREQPHQKVMFDDISFDAPDRIVRLNKQRLLDAINSASVRKSLQGLREAAYDLKDQLSSRRDPSGLFDVGGDDEETVSINQKYIFGELRQIAEAQTLQRAKYYLRRLAKSVSDIRTGKINDLNMNRWKEYEDIITDSLWIVEKRDNSGVHSPDYWGNFIPQIPNQMMKRYTKRGEWVLDTFAGCGTTAIEAQRLGRNCIGLELHPQVVRTANKLIRAEPNRFNTVSEVIEGDSRAVDYRHLLRKYGQESVQLLIMHPPYYDIIKFSTDRRDLSNAASLSEFLTMMREIVQKAAEVLDSGRYFALVIGDKYSKGEWVPLGFLTMQEVLKIGFGLKSIIVKNFEETFGKRNQKELWRYRALVGGFYIFKHEYIFLFRKK